MTGYNHKGNRLPLSRIPFDPGNDDFPIARLRRTQLPAKICFALTRNKSEKQSLPPDLGCDPWQEYFTHGQLYDAISRATHPDGLNVHLYKAKR